MPNNLTISLDRTQIIEELAVLLADILNQDKSLFNENSSAENTNGWDSLNHAVFIAEAQKHFRVSFGLKDVLGLRSLGDLATVLEAKLND